MTKKKTPAPQASRLPQQLSEYWPQFQAAAPEAIHEVRKLTRRAGAEAEVSDMKKGVRRQWRSIRRAAAPIRDHDAAGEHLLDALHELGASKTALQRFERGWAARRAELVRLHPLPAGMPAAHCLPPDWRKRADKLLEADRRELLRRGKRLMRAEDDESGSAAWHDWRKLMKRYRYTLELSGPSPAAVRDMLEQLGRLQDAEVLLDLLPQEAQLFSQTHLAALQAREEQARRDARAEARRLWPALRAHLKG